MPKFLRKIYKSLFILKRWQLGFAKIDLNDLLNQNTITTDYFDKYNIKWVKCSTPHYSNADPFLIRLDGTDIYCFYERINHAKYIKGDICAIKLDNDFNVLERRMVIRSSYHLSYPLIWEEANNLYLMPECHKAQKTTIYKANKANPWKWSSYQDILVGLKAIDATRFLRNNKEWVLYSLPAKNDPQHQLESLYIAYRPANSISSSPFQFHIKNPVKIDITSSRGAGNIFIYNDRVFRPAQNSINLYGGEMVINEIIKLSEKEFKEVPRCRILPGKNFIGVHHFSIVGDTLVIDVLAEKFVFYKQTVSLVRNIRRFFTKKRS